MPKIAIISDIHGNLSALESVISKLSLKQPDVWLCLGDIVGYGPNPVECLEKVIDLNMKTVLGNHDAGVAGLESLRLFRNPNRRLLEITRDLLSDSHIKWLKELPYILKGDSWIAAHSSPINPEKWTYMESAIKIRDMLGGLDKTFCFVGHTHIPSFVPDQLGLKNISSKHKYLINPGSVGQSRDHDPRASCAFLNTETFEYELIRVSFDHERLKMDFQNLGFTSQEYQKLLGL